MLTSLTADRSKVDNLIAHLARVLGVERENIMPFSDFVAVATAALSLRHADASFVVGGHATPEIQLAAHRAHATVVEALGVSPFIGHAEDTLERLGSMKDFIYLGNPNWVTGCNYATADLEQLAEAVPEGMLLLDEKYFDYYGISGLKLIETYSNVAILRSLTSGFGIDHDTSGYLVAAPELIERFRSLYSWHGLTRTIMTILNTTLISADARNARLALIHEESLRVATKLTELGVQNRMTSADFLLLRVADPKQAGNYLARTHCAPENLEGYPGLENYVKYRIQSPLTNDRFLDAFANMPREFYHLDNLDRRAVMFHRPAQGPEQDAGTAVSSDRWTTALDRSETGEPARLDGLGRDDTTDITH